jgi:hypothetical protein
VIGTELGLAAPWPPARGGQYVATASDVGRAVELAHLLKEKSGLL